MNAKNKQLFNMYNVHIGNLDMKEYNPRESLHKDVIGIAKGIYSLNAPGAVSYNFCTNKNGSKIDAGSFEWRVMVSHDILGNIFFMLDDVGDLEKGKYYKLK